MACPLEKLVDFFLFFQKLRLVVSGNGKNPIFGGGRTTRGVTEKKVR